MENVKSQSKNRGSYEIMIRKRGEGKYASYCPQLNLMVNGAEHMEVAQLMEAKVEEHIASLA